MDTIWDKNTQTAIINRIQKLTSTTPKKWGKMDVAQMLKHLNIAYKNALQEIEVKQHPLKIVTSFAPIKNLILFKLPFQKNLPTAQEYIVHEAENFEVNKNEFLQTFQTILLETNADNFGVHPIFGKLTYEEWGALLYKHTDHHLKQFGV